MQDASALAAALAAAAAAIGVFTEKAEESLPQTLNHCSLTLSVAVERDEKRERCVPINGALRFFMCALATFPRSETKTLR
jgi:hypothetical protein